MTSDLESALREARETTKDLVHDLPSGRFVSTSAEDCANLVARIDAALSAASGEASGDDCCENGKFNDGHTCMKQPAPSEAPNVGPAKKRRNARERAALAQYQKLRARIAELEKELDSARERGDALNAAIEHALMVDDGLEWLRAWSHGEAIGVHLRQCDCCDSARAEGIAAGLEMAAAIREAKP